MKLDLRVFLFWLRWHSGTVLVYLLKTRSLLVQRLRTRERLIEMNCQDNTLLYFYIVSNFNEGFELQLKFLPPLPPPRGQLLVIYYINTSYKFTYAIKYTISYVSWNFDKKMYCPLYEFLIIIF